MVAKEERSWCMTIRLSLHDGSTNSDSTTKECSGTREGEGQSWMHQLAGGSLHKEDVTISSVHDESICTLHLMLEVKERQQNICGWGQWPCQIENDGKYYCERPVSLAGGGAVGWIYDNVWLIGRFTSIVNKTKVLSFGLGKASKV